MRGRESHSDTTNVARADFLGSDWPARRRHVQAALRASLRDGFASLDPGTYSHGFGACEEDGDGPGTR
jgi:hypothetical protein